MQNFIYNTPTKIFFGENQEDNLAKILLSYNAYFFLTLTGDKLGITTLAPARIPFSLPFGSIVPSAVVAGSKIFG